MELFSSNPWSHDQEASSSGNISTTTLHMVVQFNRNRMRTLWQLQLSKRDGTDHMTSCCKATKESQQAVALVQRVCALLGCELFFPGRGQREAIWRRDNTITVGGLDRK